MEAEPSLERQTELQEWSAPRGLHEAPLPQQPDVIDAISASRHLDPMDARRERIVLYLLEQPNFSIIGNQVGTLRESLELTTNEWTKTRTGLVNDYGIILNRELSEGRAPRTVLNVEKLLSEPRAPEFITVQVLEKFSDNINLLDTSEEYKQGLLERVGSIMEARQKKEAHLQQEASLPKRLAPEEKKQKRKEAEEIIKSKFPKQETGNRQGAGVMSFHFDIEGHFFTTQYKADEYAKLYPLHKFILAAGLASTLNQEQDEYQEYLHRMVNKGAKESSHYDMDQVQEIGNEAINLSLARAEENRYILSNQAFDLLSALSVRRFGFM